MAHIDWITSSIPYAQNFLDSLPLHPSMVIAQATYPPPRYEKAYYMKSGALIAIPSEKNARQKILFQMTGDALEMNRTLGVTDLKLLYWLFIEHRAKFPRFDVAFDTRDSFSDPDHLLWAHQDKLSRTRIKAPVRSVREGERGITHYFGALDSPRMLRTYNKAAELKQLWEVITRVELQNRGNLAQHLVSQCVNNNDLDWTAAAAVKQLIDFPTVKWFQELMASGGVILEPLGRKTTDWQKYMKDIIFPSFINHWRDDNNGDRLFVEMQLKELQDKIKDMRNQLRGKRTD